MEIMISTGSFLSITRHLCSHPIEASDNSKNTRDFFDSSGSKSSLKSERPDTQKILQATASGED